MVKRRNSIVSLFTGAGGLDIGLESAGFSVVSATDKDPDCIATLRRNQQKRIAIGSTRLLNGTNLIECPIEDITSDQLLPTGAGRGWTPDLLTAGPPCQPFSSAGNQGALSDPRGRLFEHVLRIAKELEPRMILFENVRGIVTARDSHGKAGEVIKTIKQGFEGIGYATGFALLNAADFGCPQRRVRCFMIASREAELPDFPMPTHSKCADAGLFGPLLPWVSLGEHLARAPLVPESEYVRPSPKLERELQTVLAGSGLKSPGAKETTRPGGHWGYKQGTFIADLNLPARTVTAAQTQDWIRLPDGSLRRLSLAECAGLQGFPQEWEFCGNLQSRFRQVGNAVPISLGTALAKCIIRSLDDPSRLSERPKSQPLPLELREAIAYTDKEHSRNGRSRSQVRKLREQGCDVSLLKGRGSEDHAAI